MKKQFLAALALLVLGACGSNNKAYDATGTFEATETIISAEQNGSLLKFDVKEGNTIEAGKEVGLIDTTQLFLQIKQLKATKDVYASQKPDIRKQIAVTRQQLDKAKQEESRYTELVKDGAVPTKMLDDISNQVKVLQEQLGAQLSSLNNTTASLDKQVAATDVQVSQLQDQLRKCHIICPLNGVVLEKYVEQNEFVVIGKPLYKIADMNEMFLRAYVTSAQLQKVKLGQSVKVYADYGDRKKTPYEGVVSWISSRSEFTPKTILTDNERADLVYAVKITVKNDGFLKIGMYGEVKFE